MRGEPTQPHYEVEELPVVYVCQARGCKRHDFPRQWVRRWWLIAPSKEDPGFLIIRCPEHYTEWALRQTVYGRLTTLRDHAKEARQQPLPSGADLMPMPTYFLGARRGDAQDDVPDPREFLDDVVRQINRRKWYRKQIKPHQPTKAKRDSKGMFVTNKRRKKPNHRRKKGMKR